MSNTNVIEVSSLDIQEYVESQITGNTPKKSKAPSGKASQGNNSGFTVSQEEYIEYRINKRDSEKRRVARSRFWVKFWAIALWAIKFILGCIVLGAILMGLYILTWYVQNSLLFHNINTPVIY